jgi:hypothetical protein
MKMSLNPDQECLHRLLFAHDLYVNPRDEHKNSNKKIRLAVILIIMLFFLLLIPTVFILIRAAPTDQLDLTTTFTTNK